MTRYSTDSVSSTANPQTLKWVAEAAARAEARSGGAGRSHPTPLDHVQKLVASIMDPRVTRTQLRDLAKNISEGRA